MSKPETDLAQRTEDVFRSLAADDFATVKAQMTFLCARLLTERKVMGVWRNVISRSGRWKSCSDTRIEGTARGHSVGETHLNLESDQWLGKIAYNRMGKITGLLIVHPTEAENAPF